MLKLIKHEFKGRIRELVLMVCVLTAGNILALISVSDLQNFIPILFAISFSISINVLVIIHTLSWTGDIYGHTAPLMFTLPIGGFQIIGAKYLAIIIDFILIFIYNMLLFINNAYWNLTKEGFRKIFGFADSSQLLYPVYFITLLILIVLGILTLVYFATTLSQTMFHYHKKLGKFSAIVVIFLIMYIVIFIGNNMEGISLALFSNKVEAYFHTEISIDFFKIYGRLPLTSMRLHKFVDVVIAFVGMYFATGWLINKKLNIS